MESTGNVGPYKESWGNVLDSVRNWRITHRTLFLEASM